MDEAKLKELNEWINDTFTVTAADVLETARQYGAHIKKGGRTEAALLQAIEPLIGSYNARDQG